MALSQNPEAPETQDAALDEGETVPNGNGGWFNTQISLGSIIFGVSSLLAIGMAYQALKTKQDTQGEAIITLGNRVSANSGADTRRKNEILDKVHTLDLRLSNFITKLEERERHRVTQQEFMELRAAIRALRPNSTNGTP